MPFKGDMRLGGARRNDSTMNGMSEVPNFPAAGTVLSWIVATHEAGATAQYSAYVEGNLVEGTAFTQNARFNVVADGNGGDYVDYANPSQVEFKSSGIIVLVGLPTTNNYTNITLSNSDVIQALNGVQARALAHDGSGGISEITTAVFPYQSGTLLHAENIPYRLPYNNVYYTVGNVSREYRAADNSNGYDWSDQSLVYLPPGTQVGSVGGNYEVYVSELSTYYVSGSYGSSIIWMGEYSGFQEANMFSSYISSGTLIVNANGYDYFHNGSGGYYSNYVGTGDSGGGGSGGGDSGGGIPPYGSPTGNTSSGTNYITINGNSYENGSYSSTEYHNGAGGTYWESSYSYASYGTLFFSESYSDEYNTYNTYYYSDGNGSYYTGS